MLEKIRAGPFGVVLMILTALIILASAFFWSPMTLVEEMWADSVAMTPVVVVIGMIVFAVAFAGVAMHSRGQTVVNLVGMTFAVAGLFDPRWLVVSGLILAAVVVFQAYSFIRGYVAQSRQSYPRLDVVALPNRWYQRLHALFNAIRSFRLKIPGSVVRPLLL